MITLSKDSIKDYLDWIKNMITICSAAIGALVYKFDVTSQIPWKVKTSAVLFVITMISLLVSYTALVEHKNTPNDKMEKKHSFSIVASWVLFLSSFGFLTANFF